MTGKSSSVAIRLVFFYRKFYMISLSEEETRSFNWQRAALCELKSFMRSIQNKAVLNHINSHFDSLAVTIIATIIAAAKTHLKSSQNRADQTNSAACLMLKASEKQPPPSPAPQFRRPIPKTNCWRSRWSKQNTCTLQPEQQRKRRCTKSWRQGVCSAPLLLLHICSYRTFYK